MSIQTAENGVAQELQRIERDFTSQRSSLQAESAQFAQWQTDWDQRQQSIDDSLSQLKERLQNTKRQQEISIPATLKFEAGK